MKSNCFSLRIESFLLRKKGEDRKWKENKTSYYIKNCFSVFLISGWNKMFYKGVLKMNSWKGDGVEEVY